MEFFKGTRYSNVISNNFFPFWKFEDTCVGPSYLKFKSQDFPRLWDVKFSMTSLKADLINHGVFPLMVNDK